MLRIDLDEATSFYRVGIYGEPGTGKTSIGATAPDPLFILSERNGIPHIRKSAARVGRKVAGVVFVERFHDYRLILRALKQSIGKPRLVIPGTTPADPPAYSGRWPKTLVIDHVTDAARLCTLEIRGTVQKNSKGDQKLDRDGLPREADAYWRHLVDRMTALITGFRDLPCHIVFLAHQKNEKVKRGIGRHAPVDIHAKPMLPTEDLVRVFVGSVNVVGQTFRRVEGGRLVWGISTGSADNVVSKPLPPLRTREVPDLTDWFDRLDAEAREGRVATEIEGDLLDADAYDEDPKGDAPVDLDTPDDDATDHAPDDDGTDDDGAEGYFASKPAEKPARTERVERDGDGDDFDPSWGES